MPGTLHVRRSRRATRSRQPRRGRTNREKRWWAALEAQYPESVYDIIADRMLAGGALGLEAPTAYLGMIAAKNAKTVLHCGFTSTIGSSNGQYLDVCLKEAITNGVVEGPRMLACSHEFVTSGEMADGTNRSWFMDLGNHGLLRCLGCGARFARGEVEIDPERLPPHCPDCGGLVKSDTVAFGEPIPEDVLARSTDEVGRADCMLVAGTSATVYPAAGFPLEVVRGGGSLIEINPEPTDLTPLAAVHLCGPGGPLLARLVERVRIRLAEAA